MPIPEGTTWTVRRRLLTFFPFVFLLVVAAGWTVEELSPRGTIDSRTLSLLLGVFAAILVFTFWEAIRPRFLVDQHGVTQIRRFGQSRFAWDDLTDLTSKGGAHVLHFGDQSLTVKESDLFSSRLGAAAAIRLDRTLDRPLHRSLDPEAVLRFGGADRFKVPASVTLTLYGPLMISSFFRVMSPTRDMWAASMGLCVLVGCILQAGLSWKLDASGISSSWFGLFRKKKMRWEDVTLVTGEQFDGRCVLWSDQDYFVFERIERKGRTFLDEVLGRVPPSTPLFLYGLILPAQKPLVVTFADDEQTA